MRLRQTRSPKTRDVAIHQIMYLSERILAGADKVSLKVFCPHVFRFVRMRGFTGGREEFDGVRGSLLAWRTSPK
jgi:hypothetical protein